MAVVTVYDAHSRTASATMTGRKYTTVHRVLTNSASDGPQVVGNGCSINIGDYYAWGNDSDERAYCTSLNVNPEGDSLTLWTVTATFETLDAEQQKLLVAPLSRDYEVSYGFENYQEVVERDVDGFLLMNTAGEYFDPPVERDASRPVLTISRNEPEFPTSLVLSYANAINSDYFFGGMAGTVKVFNISGNRVVEEFNQQEYVFWRMTYEFHYNPDGWAKNILSMGRSQLGTDSDGNVVRKKITYENSGDQVVDPVPLNENGAVIPKDDLPDAAVFIPFNVYKALPFSAFGF